MRLASGLGVRGSIGVPVWQAGTLGPPPPPRPQAEATATTTAIKANVRIPGDLKGKSRCAIGDNLSAQSLQLSKYGTQGRLRRLVSHPRPDCRWAGEVPPVYRRGLQNDEVSIYQRTGGAAPLVQISAAGMSSNANEPGVQGVCGDGDPSGPAAGLPGDIVVGAAGEVDGGPRPDLKPVRL